jgi:hypothetical protein
MWAPPSASAAIQPGSCWLVNCSALSEVMAMVIRFKESVRVRVWGRELSNFRKGEVHAVPTAVAGVLLAQGCAEPVSDDTTPDLRRAS